MKIICSWCKKFMGEKEPFEDPSASHSRCSDCLKKQIKPNPNKLANLDSSRRRLIGIDEASDYLGLTKNTLYSWVSQRRVPHVKIGRLTKFDLKDLDTWIQKQKVETHKHWDK